MAFTLVRAALNAASEFERSADRIVALKIMQERQPGPDDVASDAAADADRFLRTIVGQMKASAERLLEVLSGEQSAADLNKEFLLFRENVVVLLSITRQLKGGKLPIAALYEMESLL